MRSRGLWGIWDYCINTAKYYLWAISANNLSLSELK